MRASGPQGSLGPYTGCNVAASSLGPSHHSRTPRTPRTTPRPPRAQVINPSLLGIAASHMLAIRNWTLEMSRAGVPPQERVNRHLLVFEVGAGYGGGRVGGRSSPCDSSKGQTQRGSTSSSVLSNRHAGDRHIGVDTHDGAFVASEPERHVRCTRSHTHTHGAGRRGGDGGGRGGAGAGAGAAGPLLRHAGAGACGIGGGGGRGGIMCPSPTKGGIAPADTGQGCGGGVAARVWASWGISAMMGVTAARAAACSGGREPWGQA